MDEREAQIDLMLGRAESASEPAEQATILVEVARLYEEVGQPDRAFLVLGTAYRVRPDAGTRAALERLAALTGRGVELDAVVTEAMAELPPEARAEAWRALGRFRLHRLRQPERALEALDVALALEPDREAALERAEALELCGRHAELAAALGALADAAPSPEEAVRLYLRQAGLCEKKLADPAGAEAAYRRALALAPGDVEARTRLGQLEREAAERCEREGRYDEAVDRYEGLRAARPGDLGPHRALERLYGQLGRLRDQLAALEALAGLVESDRERAVVHRKMARLCLELGARARAAECLEWVLVYEPSEEAFRALEAHYRAEGNVRALADVYARHAKAADPARRHALLRELAEVYARELDDASGAIACLEALVAEGDEAARAELVDLYEAVEAFDRAADALERWSEDPTDGRVRAERLHRAAELVRTRLEDPARAAQLEERALTADPQLHAARLGLAACHQLLGEPGVALQVIKLGDLTDDALAMAAARLDEELGDVEAALAALKGVLERKPDHAEAADRAFALLAGAGRHGELLALAARLPADGPPERQVARALAVARAALGVGDRALAKQAAEIAVRHAPERPDVRCLEAELLLREGERPKAELIVAELRAREADLGLAERVTVEYLAGECARLRGDADGALERYRVALELDPAHRGALRGRLDLAVDRGLWLDALASLDGLHRVERDRFLRGRYLQLAGHVCEEELGRDEDAERYYRAAIAEHPLLRRAGERLEAIWRARGDYAPLAEYCARVLEHLGPGGDVPEKTRLWATLADAALGLGDHDGALAALEVVARLDRDHREARERLAVLYLAAGDDRLDKAIQARMELVRLDKGSAPNYAALEELYNRVGQRERAAACARAVAVLEGRRLPAAETVELAARPLTATEWGFLRHPDEDRYLGVLSSLVAPLLAAQGAVPLDPQGGVPGQAVGRDDPRPFLQALRLTARLLDVPVPEPFLRHDQMAPVRFVNGRAGQALKAALVVGLPLLGDRRRVQDLVPALALEVAQLRPERYLRLLVPDAAALALVLKAVVAVSLGEEPGAGVQETAAALKRHLQPVALDQLTLVGRRLGERSDELVQIAAAWLRAADLTAARAALALTGDLERTVQSVEAMASSPAAARAAVVDLVWASITHELWTVRRRLLQHAAGRAGAGAQAAV